MGARSHRHGAVSAFTLIETVCVIVILSLVGTMVAQLLGQYVIGFRDATVQAQLHAETGVALDRLVRELRNIELASGTTDPEPDITSAATTELNWGTGRSITWSSNQILLNADGSNTDILASDVTAVAFDYFDDDDQTLLSGGSVPPSRVAEIRRISVSITLTRTGVTETLRARVFLRCLITGGGTG